MATAGYDTGFVGSQPSLAACAGILKTEIDNRYKDYSDIALLAHSQGGLISRTYIAERLNSGQPLRVSRLLTFATPHHGSGHATLLKRVLFSSQQVKDLDYTCARSEPFRLSLGPPALRSSDAPPEPNGQAPGFYEGQDEPFRLSAPATSSDPAAGRLAPMSPIDPSPLQDHTSGTAHSPIYKGIVSHGRRPEPTGTASRPHPAPYNPQGS